MKRRLLLISTMYPTKNYPSFGVFIRNQVEKIEQSNYNVDLLVIKNPKKGKANLIKKYSKWLLQWLGILLFKRNQYEVIHAHYIFPSGMLGLLIKRITKATLIVTAHGGDIDKMAKVNKLTYHFTKKVLTEADHVIAVGQKLKEEIINEYNVEESNVSLINMGVNREIFYPQNKLEVRKKLDINSETKLILFVGNVIKAKGVKELIKAFGKLNMEYKQLYVIGATNDSVFLSELQEMINKERIEQVFFKPATTQKEIALWMNAADVQVVPSYIEGFGLVALEAMACHTPVIGTRVGGLKYLLNDNAGILIEPKSSEQIQKGLQQLLFNQEDREKMIAKGEVKARENDQDIMLNKLLTLYNR